LLLQVQLSTVFLVLFEEVFPAVPCRHELTLMPVQLLVRDMTAIYRPNSMTICTNHITLSDFRQESEPSKLVTGLNVANLLRPRSVVEIEGGRGLVVTAVSTAMFQLVIVNPGFFEGPILTDLICSMTKGCKIGISTPSGIMLQTVLTALPHSFAITNSTNDFTLFRWAISVIEYRWVIASLLRDSHYR
jgi:hypothetical protein